METAGDMEATAIIVIFVTLMALPITITIQTQRTFKISFQNKEKGTYYLLNTLS